MFISLNKKGQSTLEYAVIIAVVVAALIAMQVYFKRGVQGKMREATDQIGEQYSPGNTTSIYNTTAVVTSEETVVGGDAPITNSTSGQKQTRTGSETVQDFSKEVWQ